MLERIGSVKCLLLLIVVCTKGEEIFSNVVKITKLKDSTAWSCVKKLEKESMIETKKALTLKGPRTLLVCTKEGLKALEEVRELLQH